MTTKLPEYVLNRLRYLEPKLKAAGKYGKFDEAQKIAQEIQNLFPNDLNHHRLLQARNWFFQAALEDNQTIYAINGFNGIRIRAADNTRTYLEATVMLGICYLRNNDIKKAKEYIRESILKINNIKSDQRRNQLQKRIITRIEFECLLGQLKMETGEYLPVEELHKKAIEMVKNKSDQEIFGIVGEGLPQAALQLTENIKDYSVKLLPIGDQKLLAPPPSVSKTEFGKKVIDIVKRVGWRSVCDPEGEIYNLWSKQVPDIFNKGYFAGAIATTCAKFSIGLPILAVGVVAILMKHSAAEFCERYQPKDIMIDKKDK